MSPTADIKASDVQKVRQMTGAGLMDCKKALKDAAGDFDKAVKLLRERGIAKSSKRSDRVASEGLVVNWIAPGGKEGILFELNCETDFVARNQEFLALANDLLEKIKKNPSWTSVKELPTDPVAELSGKVGEKMSASRFARFQPPKGGIVSSYIHSGSKLGVLLELQTNQQGSPSKELEECAKEISLQIAGANPTYVSRQDVPATVLEKEKEITKKQMESQKKPPEILEKIATGKLEQYYSLHCLLDQSHVRDSTGKKKVKDFIADVAKKTGADIHVSKFVRYRVGSE